MSTDRESLRKNKDRNKAAAAVVVDWKREEEEEGRGSGKRKLVWHLHDEVVWSVIPITAEDSDGDALINFSNYNILRVRQGQDHSHSICGPLDFPLSLCVSCGVSIVKWIHFPLGIKDGICEIIIIIVTNLA